MAREDVTPELHAGVSSDGGVAAEAPAPGEALPELPAEDFARLLDRAYRGLWGHKQVAAGLAAPPVRSSWRGACGVLGDEPVDLDSWGGAPEVIDAYRRLGFEPVEQVRGWELRIGS